MDTIGHYLLFKEPLLKRSVLNKLLLLAAANHVQIQYDTRAQAPFFRYTDTNGKQHEVWFEDARSIQAKFNLIKELGLRGMSYWKLGLSFPQNWLLITENFNVVKIAR